ncbi:proline iminopeptidase, partial [Candidatus Endoriftia persephone str. Guaymas]|nr:proline iminopeptidase [Candidatus Endoriftia persephone str. Guaymas]
RNHLGIERWLLFGGSWGSTLALAYAERHPQRVSAMILRGIFLCREEEIQWFYQQGASRIFPDYWQDYLAPIPQEERGDL